MRTHMLSSSLLVVVAVCALSTSSLAAVALVESDAPQIFGGCADKACVSFWPCHFTGLQCLTGWDCIYGPTGVHSGCAGNSTGFHKGCKGTDLVPRCVDEGYVLGWGCGDEYVATCNVNLQCEFSDPQFKGGCGRFECHNE